MTTILLENITGVRVVRAFNNEEREQNRMSDAFSNYAETSIKANRRFANLDGLSYFFINLFVVIVYWLSGGYISLGNLQIGDITAVIQYAMMVMFFTLDRVFILTMPRALECCERIRAVLEHSPEIRDLVEQDDQKLLPNQDEVSCLPQRLLPICRRGGKHPVSPELQLPPRPDNRNYRRHRKRQIHRRIPDSSFPTTSSAAPSC